MGLLDLYAGKKLESYKPTGDGLLNVGKKTVDSLLDPESPISKKAAGWNRKLQKGIQHALEGKDTPYAEFAYQEGLNMAGMGAMTAWHGSPHKFDKFSLDKIGTGEGAQAYGHGLYLAENPSVAKDYAEVLSDSVLKVDGKPFNAVAADTKSQAVKAIAAQGYDRSIKAAQEMIDNGADPVWMKNYIADLNALKTSNIGWETNGQLYKTDIPDEAVARFLDWDKPLSQQAPEVQAALGDLALKNQAHIGGVPIRQFIYDKTQQTGSLPSVVIGEIEKAGSLDAALPALQRKFSGANDAAKSKLDELLVTLKQQQISMQTGVDSVRTGGDIVRGGYNPPEIAQMLRSHGIPGIRYLDGGSRSAGEGSSNFVVFDPEMIRILERNGQSTGLLPWGPGEYGLLK